MDYSHLHTYTPPHCVPENTGYTYALSSSYSSTALDFETEHKLDPVFDSPRMSRRSLRLSATAYGTALDTHKESSFSSGSYSGKKAFADQLPRITKQHKSFIKQSGSVQRTPRKNVPSSSFLSHSSFSSHTSDASLMSTILDESSIQEQTAVDHFWGLDDDGDLKGGDTTAMQANGDIATAESQAALSNGYTCHDCSMLSERKEVLTAHSAPRMPASRIYSRDRSQKHKARGLPFYTNQVLQAAKYTATSFTSLLVQLFQMILLKLGYDYEAHSNYCGSMNVKEFLREDGHLGMNGESLWKAAAGVFWWLGTGWYQFVTLVSLLNVFLLTRCLPKMFRLLLCLLPLLLLLGLWHWGSEGFLSLLPALNWTSMQSIPRMYRWEDSAKDIEPRPDSPHAFQHADETTKFFDSSRMRELEEQMAFMSERWHHRDEEYGKMLLLLQNFQDQVTQMNDKSEMLMLIKNVVAQHISGRKPDETTHTTHDFLALHQEHEWRIAVLEDLLAKLSEKSEGIQKELDLTKARTMSDSDEQNQHLFSKIKRLELELSQMKLELLSLQGVKTSCDRIDTLHEKVDAQVRESVRFMFYGNQQQELPESLLQWLTSRFVSKSDLQALLRDLELRILRNITLHMSATHSRPTAAAVTSIVNGSGLAGITEAQAHVIVNNALKLYSQDRTGMVDFALESGGGSILSTRCSETYETKTALMSLFGIPLWYFSQSPRVVIQPDMYPGNCWAFKGSQGYLVVRLSMMIYPTTFSLEHIPKTLSPTGNITSAPKDFSVYGLEDEYQEEGVLLGQYTYDQDGEPLQMFQVMEATEKTFQIVELRISSNWGHTEYTCLYRFRVHGRPAG
ncbi:SUN domain-containing protein 1 isoform X18 [Hemicordylus capensis]|uniref:SUN domain-containing protein 1 isoform X18 n=1 Tax=Hemicordylus capensis TaxID=884348 RepID=UPI0023042986|nr:SUN domain-containing protein 1 isoform X18 [Hemicordylus capensis]